MKIGKVAKKYKLTTIEFVKLCFYFFVLSMFGAKKMKISRAGCVYQILLRDMKIFYKTGETDTADTMISAGSISGKMENTVVSDWDESWVFMSSETKNCVLDNSCVSKTSVTGKRMTDAFVLCGRAYTKV